jgi:hypothetical protein
MAEVPIWIVSADHWPRAFLRAELIERGYDATGFVTLEDAAKRLMRGRALRPALLVLDRRDQVMDESTSALLSRQEVPVLAVADIAHPGDAPAGPVVEILRRPVTIGAIADAVDRRLRPVPPGLRPVPPAAIRRSR